MSYSTLRFCYWHSSLLYIDKNSLIDILFNFYVLNYFEVSTNLYQILIDLKDIITLPKFIKYVYSEYSIIKN